jgi:cyclic di-GMP phosphodiesterase Gmr
MSNSPLSQQHLVGVANEESQFPRWSFGQDSDVLTLSQDMGAGSNCLQLSPAQCQALRELGAAQQCLRIRLDGTCPVDLVLIGKKIGIGLWGGWASRANDAEGIVFAAQRALAFAEQIISEVNSQVVVMDRNFKVRRFNRLCEEGALAFGKAS